MDNNYLITCRIVYYILYNDLDVYHIRPLVKTSVPIRYTYEWEDKAGGYAIQGTFAKHVKRINGDYYNVVGLPISRLYRELKKLSSI